MADSVEVWTAAACKKYLKKPKESDHKYSRGVLSCITGSRKYPGAALLTTSAAIATGVGMVRYLGPNSVSKSVILNRPTVVITKGRSDVLLLGSGIADGFSIENLFRRYLLAKANRLTLPKVLDAGALYLVRHVNAPTIITPHVGELSKLLNVEASEISSDPIKYAQLAAKEFQVTVLLKGHETVVANPDRVIKLPPASSYLASAGTGDILAGILGALIAINKSEVGNENLIEIGATASFIHALAANEKSIGPINSTEMLVSISKIVTQLTE